MIDLFASDELRSLYPKFKHFVEQELISVEGDLLNRPWEQVAPILEGLRQKAKEAQLWNPSLPSTHGGLGLNMLDFAQVSELLAMTPFGHYVVNSQAPDIGNIELLEKYASPTLKKQYLEPLIEGEIRSCFSMTEPEFAGSNPLQMATSAQLDGDQWVISGHKWFTTAADGAAFAVVMAVTNQEGPAYQKASMIIVPTDTPGFELVRNIPIMGEAGGGYQSHGEIRYHQCRVPQDHLVGEAGQGFVLAQERLGPGRIHHCMRWIGICERAFQMMCTRAAERDMGDGSKLGNKQTIQHWIAESRASIDAARYMVLHTAMKLDKEGTKSARQAISTIKFFVADVLMKVLDRAIQVHGALGITDDLVLAWWYRHERGARIYDGPDEVHKSSLARSILKSYGLTK